MLFINARSVCKSVGLHGWFYVEQEESIDTKLVLHNIVSLANYKLKCIELSYTLKINLR